MFMTRPMGPVALMVTISTAATTTPTRAADRGPKMKPAIAMMVSFTSRVRKPATGGMRKWQTKMTA